jgi:penicillin-binding protein 1A
LKNNVVLVFKFLLISFVTFSILGVLLVMGVYLHYSGTLPKIIEVSDYNPKVVTQVYDTNDVKIGEFYREKREIIKYEDIPKVVINAFVSSEDSRFFEHKGLDFSGILRAMIANFKSGRFSQGGSTITQQVARSLLLSSEKKISRKIKEAMLAGKIETHLSKDEILFLYLNQIYLGHNAYGIQTATRSYFNKDVSQISLAEAALLAGLPQAPSKWSPFSNPNKAKERQIYVLTRMVEEGYISKDAAEKAANERLKLYKRVDINLANAPYFTEFVRRYLFSTYGGDKVLDEGLKVYTTVNTDLQKVAQKSVKEGLRDLDRKQGFRGPIAHLRNEEAIKSERVKIHKEIIQSVRDYIYFPEPWQEFNINSKMFESKSENSKTDDSELEEPTPLDKDKIYKAIVLSLDHKTQEIKIIVGNTPGLINRDGFAWAYTSGKLDNSTIRTGDLINVSLLKPGVFELEQIPQVESALLSFNVSDGAILSMVGGYDYSASEFNRAYQSKRQAGSTFKPIVYSAALDKGFTVGSVIMDSPIVYGEDESGDTWKPTNYSERFYGDTLLRDALILSRNIPTTKILQDIKPSFVIEYAKNIGISSQMPNDLSLGLGSTAVSVWEMTKAFAVFASGGKRVIPYFIRKIEDRKGELIEEHNPEKISDYVMNDSEKENTEIKDEENIDVPESDDPKEDTKEEIEEETLYDKAPAGFVIPPQTAYIMNYLLKETATRGTGSRVGAAIKAPIAGKTGTSNNYTDAWFVGYTPEVATGVWVGFDDNSKSLGHGQTGASAAIPVWIPYMKAVVQNSDKKDFTQPRGIKFVRIDGKTGNIASRLSQKILVAPFKDGTEPKVVEGETNIEDVDEAQFFRQNY